MQSILSRKMGRGSISMGMRNNRLRVAVGLSGGVDSSVTASLLKEKGYNVVGITMEIFDGSIAVQEAERHGCFGPGEKEDIEKAASVCEKLRIPFHVIDLRKEYRNHVINYFRTEYLSGRTPNPCIVCNRRLKFGLLLEKAKQAGVEFDLFSTGHYAQIVRSKGRYLLKKAVDQSKDQTYFLYTLTPEQLSHTLFPLGKYTKEQVRKIAHSVGLETAYRPESQDFIANGDYSPLFTEEEFKEGPIVDENGNILGKHRGIIHYTVGQRRGIGISSNRRLYVVKIDAENNRIVISDKENLFSEGLMAKELNLMAVEKLDRPYKVKAKIRLKHREADATVFPHEHNTARVVFDEPQMSVTPGQAVVFYLNDTVFGGGIIERAL
jgi:tRNA-specific 2-thiouridylase